jgi:uncharacterized ParB-like nuclease family protein
MNQIEPMSLRVDEIRADSVVQAREGLDEATIEAYADAMRDAADFPPVQVFHDGYDDLLADGFHRQKAAERAGIETIRAHVSPGGLRDAIFFAAGANATHGLRRTNADKRKAVGKLLDDPEWTQWSDRRIAEQCGVSDRFVNQVRAERSANRSQTQSTRKAKRRGKTYQIDTSNIGAKPAAETRTQR